MFRIHARTLKRLLIPNNSRCRNFLSHQWCTPFDMNRQTNGHSCCAHPWLQFFVKSNCALTWSEGVRDDVVTPTKTSHLHVPLHQRLTLQLLLLYCLVCLAENNYAGISWSYQQAHSERATDSVMQAVDFCYSMNMSMIRSLCPPGTISHCSTVDSCKESDIVRLIPAGCFSLHQVFFYLYIRISVLSCIIKQYVFRVLCVSSVQIILICLRKQSVSLSDEIMLLACSHTLVTES